MIRCLLLCFALLVTAPAMAETAAPAPSEKDLERVRTRIQALQRTLERKRGAKDEARRALEDIERQLAALGSELRELARRIEAQQTQLAKTQAELRNIEQSLALSRTALAGQLRAAYRLGQRSHTRLLLNLEDAHRLGRALTYFDYLNRQRSEDIRAVEAHLARTQEVESRLSSETEQLQSLRSQREKAAEKLTQQRSERDRAIARIESQISDSVAEIQQLEATEKELQQLLSSLDKVLEDLPLPPGGDRPFPELKGQLPWPARGKLIADFGQPKAGGKLSWNGIWIAAPEGTPVRAVARGRVAYIGWLHRYGLLLVVEHDGGYFSLYGHNASVGKKEGDPVRAGETLAAAGSSGGHAETGVYFEVRKGTEPINPGPWLQN